MNDPKNQSRHGFFIRRLEVFSLRFDKNGIDDYANVLYISYDSNGNEQLTMNEDEDEDKEKDEEKDKDKYIDNNGDFKGIVFIVEDEGHHQIYNNSVTKDYFVDIDPRPDGPEKKKKKKLNEVEMQDSCGSSQKSSERYLPMIGPDKGMIILGLFDVIVHMDSGKDELEDLYLQRASRIYAMRGCGIEDGNFIRKIEGDELGEWMPYHNDPYDNVRPLHIYGSFGSLTLDYIVFSDSKQVSFEVKLLIEGENHATDIDIQGELSVSSDAFPKYKSVLFQTQPNNVIQVVEDMLIPLPKFLVAMPYDSGFKVSADLFVPHHGFSFKGSLEFPFTSLNKENPYYYCTKYVVGVGGMIQVYACVSL